MSTPGEHGWLCYNDGPGAVYWFATREECEHELTSDIWPATAIEKAVFEFYGADKINKLVTTRNDVDVMLAKGYEALKSDLVKREIRRQAEYRYSGSGQARRAGALMLFFALYLAFMWLTAWYAKPVFLLFFPDKLLDGTAAWGWLAAHMALIVVLMIPSLWLIHRIDRRQSEQVEAEYKRLLADVEPFQ